MMKFQQFALLIHRSSQARLKIHLFLQINFFILLLFAII